MIYKISDEKDYDSFVSSIWVVPVKKILKQMVYQYTTFVSDPIKSYDKYYILSHIIYIT